MISSNNPQEKLMSYCAFSHMSYVNIYWINSPDWSFKTILDWFETKVANSYASFPRMSTSVVILLCAVKAVNNAFLNAHSSDDKNVLLNGLVFPRI